MPAEQAELALSRAGFSLRRRTVPDNEYPPGYIVGQSPAAGATAPGGSTVTLLVSADARRTAEVPDVLGRKQADAVAAVKGAGFGVQLEAQPEGDPAKAVEHAGLVWKQSPGGGGPADAGSTVVLWVNPA
jgi:serine/threonine-protein kinase